MDSSDVARIVGSASTVSDKIRALDAAGYPRTEIARLLGKRYQHVRNVLEADKLHGKRAPRSPPDPGGMQEAPTAYCAMMRLELDGEGGVRFPPEVLGALGYGPRGVLIAELREDGLMVFSHRANMARLDAVMAPYRKLHEGGPLASDELIADRRAEAAHESGG